MNILWGILLVMAILCLLPTALPMATCLLGLCVATLAFIAWIICVVVGAILKGIGNGLKKIGSLFSSEDMGL